MLASCACRTQRSSPCQQLWSSDLAHEEDRRSTRTLGRGRRAYEPNQCCWTARLRTKPATFAVGAPGPCAERGARPRYQSRTDAHASYKRAAERLRHRPPPPARQSRSLRRRGRRRRRGPPQTFALRAGRAGGGLGCLTRCARGSALPRCSAARGSGPARLGGRVCVGLLRGLASRRFTSLPPGDVAAARRRCGGAASGGGCAARASARVGSRFEGCGCGRAQEGAGGRCHAHAAMYMAASCDVHGTRRSPGAGRSRRALPAPGERRAEGPG